MQHDVLDLMLENATLTGWATIKRPLPVRPGPRDAVRAWREAAAETRAALAAWFMDGGAEEYLRYRAAREREDAAQDLLACTSRSGPRHGHGRDHGI